jgi:hypothetical protein
MSPSFDEIRITSRGKELVAAGGAVTIGPHTFYVGTVDRLIYHAAARINHASYLIGLGQGDTKARFMFDAYRRGTEMADRRAEWGRLVDLFEATVAPRLADDAARSIAAGGTVRFGSPAIDGIDADAVGLRRHRPLARKVPWADITGAELSIGLAKVWTARAGVPATKPAMFTDMSGWNAVILPRVVAIFTRR